MNEKATEVEVELANLEYRSGLLHDAKFHLEDAVQKLTNTGKERPLEKINILLAELRRLTRISHQLS